MAGLSPEEIAQVRSYEIGGERVRQQSIGSMIEAELGLSKEDLDAARVALLHAQEQRASRLLEPEIAAKIAQRKREEAALAKAEFELQQNKELAPLERNKLQADIDARRQSIEASKAGTALDYGRLADIGATRAEQRRQFELTHPEVSMPQYDPVTGEVTGRQTIRPTASDVLRESTRTSGEMTEAQKMIAADRAQQRERQATEDERKRQERAAELEGTITGKNTKGQLNVNDPGTAVDVDELNRISDKDYFYKYVPSGSGRLLGIPGTGASPRVDKIPLRDESGRPLKARHVYQGWLEFRQKTRSDISLEDYVSTQIRRGK